MLEDADNEDAQIIEDMIFYGEGYNTYLQASEEEEDKKILKEVPEALDKYKAID